ncbi:MAG: malonyl-CoA decarboxylase domain-containing protein [Candidatus Binataceae bacterium]
MRALIRAALADTSEGSMRTLIEELSGPGDSSKARKSFLSVLARDFDLDRRLVIEKSATLSNLESHDSWREAVSDLREALVPARVRLLKRFGESPEGLKLLVDLREELLKLGRDDSVMRQLEHELRPMIATWFDVGILELKRLTWNSPAAVLEKLVRYESVHEIRGWRDLKKRLDPDRRCFAFFHSCMPGEPLTFVEVALVQGLATHIASLLDEKAPRNDPKKADTAIFYSISNCRKGLAGINLAHFLIKRAVDELKRELPSLNTFATLSPVPGFAAWLKSYFAEASTNGADPLTRRERAAIASLPRPLTSRSLIELMALPEWYENQSLSLALRQPLMRLCAHYLIDTRNADGGAADPVAHFHLSNGARIERINWMADLSPKGISQSYGLMVNYRY